MPRIPELKLLALLCLAELRGWHSAPQYLAHQPSDCLAFSQPLEPAFLRQRVAFFSHSRAACLHMHPSHVSEDTKPRLLRLRGGLLKKKSKEAHAKRKAERRGNSWSKFKEIREKSKPSEDRNTRKILDACSNGDVQEVERLLAEGANVNARKRFGTPATLLSTPLHQAASYGHPKLVKLLVERGAQVNMVDTHRRTALHYAAVQGNTECCQQLLASGADVHATDSKGFTALDDAETSTFPTAAARSVLQDAGALRNGAHSLLNGDPHRRKGRRIDPDDEEDGAENESAMPEEDAKDAYKMWADETWGPGASRKRIERAKRQVGPSDDPDIERVHKPGKRSRKRAGARDKFYMKDEKLRVAEKRFREAGNQEGADKMRMRLQSISQTATAPS